MPVEIRQANLRDACYVAANMRANDRFEIDAVVETEHPVQIAAMLLDYSKDLAFCAYIDGQPVTVFGVHPSWPRTCVAGWAYGTERLKRTIPRITDYAVKVLVPELVRRGYRRLQVHTYVGHDLSHRWLEGMGLTCEGVAVGYGLHGEDFAVYAATRR